ncbi:MAG: Gfo/Idh/MocA family oxidoreductase [Aggregatilineales bacterium]
MNDPLRIAVIGAGKIAEMGHIPGFQKAGAKVVALCSRTETNLSLIADQFDVERRYTDWQQMLKDGNFDAVSICTPVYLHAEMTVACLHQGYHVLLEKPIAASLADCDAMIAAADQSNCILMLAHNQRFRLQHIIAKQVLDSGRLGIVRRVHSAFAHGGPEYWSPNQQWYFDPVRAGQGAMMDLGYHKIDLLRWLLGQEVKEIHALKATFEKPTTADDTSVAIMQFEQGTLATLQASWAHFPGVPDSLDIFCENGTLHIPSNPSDPIHIVERENGQLRESDIDCSAAEGPGWLDTMQAFIDAVRTGEPSVSARDARATLHAVLRAYDI